jgi:hypothetical protein
LPRKSKAAVDGPGAPGSDTVEQTPESLAAQQAKDSAAAAKDKARAIRAAKSARIARAVPTRIRKAFQINALFALVCGLIFMLNPLLGPKFPLDGGFVSLLGFGLLIVTVMLGMAGLGKGSFASKLRGVAITNAAVGVAFIAAALLVSMVSAARVALYVLAACLLAFAVWEFMVLTKPNGTQQYRASPEELKAAISGKRPQP